MADVRAAAYFVGRAIHIMDEKGDVQHVMGAKKSGDPIFLRVIGDDKGGLSHMEPLNLTTAQKEQYKGLDHTKNDCMFNALFVHLPKEKQELFRDVQGMRVATAQHIKANPKIYNDLYIYQEKLRQIAPAEVPRVGFLIPLVQAGLAAWTLYQCWQTSRAIVNDPKVQESLEKREYRDMFWHGLKHLPVVGDGIGMSDAWGVGNYRNAGLHAANVLFTLYGGRFIGQGGRYLFNRVKSNVVGQLGGRRGLAKRGGVGVSNVLTEKIKSLPTIRTKLTPHSIERLAERGITKKMAEKVIEKGLRYYNPKHQSITYILPNGMASGKHLVIAIDPSSGMLKTVYTSRPTYFPKHLIPID